MLKTDRLLQLSELIKISKLCEKANLSVGAIHGKMARKTQLNVDEAESLESVLAEFGIKLVDVPKIQKPKDLDLNLLRKANFEALIEAKND